MSLRKDVVYQYIYLSVSRTRKDALVRVNLLQSYISRRRLSSLAFTRRTFISYCNVFADQGRAVALFRDVRPSSHDISWKSHVGHYKAYK